MHQRDLISNVAVSQAFAPKVVTSTEVSGVIDLRGFNSNILSALIGTSGDTLSGSVKLELEVRESDDGASFTAVTDDDLSATVTATNTGTFGVIDDPAEDDMLYKTSYKGSKRYLAVYIIVTGTHTNGTPISIIANLGNPSIKPVA